MEDGRGEKHEKDRKKHGSIVDCKRRIREHARTEEGARFNISEAILEELT